jgi:molybdopterin-guanine dinucleotide biosynthesis protein MobB
MKIFAVVGPSGIGKTSLIEQLLAEIKRRGLSAAVIKHCSQGFSLDRPGKDSWRFRAAGADGVALVSPEETAVLQRKAAEAEDIEFASTHFGRMDIVLVEGIRVGPHIPKLELLRKEVSERLLTPPDELAAVVSDFEIEVSRPVFHFGQTKEIVDFLERGAQTQRQRAMPRSVRSRQDEKA